MMSGSDYLLNRDREFTAEYTATADAESNADADADAEMTMVHGR